MGMMVYCLFLGNAEFRSSTVEPTLRPLTPKPSRLDPRVSTPQRAPKPMNEDTLTLYGA